MHRILRPLLLAVLAILPSIEADEPVMSARAVSAVIIPIREEVSAPLTYLVRRGVKEAIRSDASILILDMETPGGR